MKSTESKIMFFLFAVFFFAFAISVGLHELYAAIYTGIISIIFCIGFLAIHIIDSITNILKQNKTNE